MYSKQDAVRPRTAEDLDRKYNFGKTFAETNKLIAENAKTVDESNKAIAKIARSVLDHEASITSLTEWKGETNSSIASITQSVSEQKATIESLTKIDGETLESLASINQTVTEQGAEISSIASWKGDVEGDVESIASIEQRVTNAESTIELLTELNNGDQSSLAALVTKVNANEASIESLTEWKDDTTDSLASVTQKANANETNITSLTEWKDTVNGDIASIAKISQKANANEANITTLTEWKGGVEDDISSIATIEQKANANEAKITSLTEWKDGTTTNLATITQRVDDQGALIEAKASKETVEAVATKFGDYYTKTETDSALKVRDDAISLRATKTEVTTAKKEAIESANDSTDDKLKSYSTTAEMNAAIEVSAGNITSSVRSTYTTKQEMSDASGRIDTLSTNLGDTINRVGTLEKQDIIQRTTLAEIKQTADQNRAGIELYAEFDVNGTPTASGSLVIEAINGESSAKISADRLDIEGKELNIKVASTNIQGSLSADQIRSGVLKSHSQLGEGQIGIWENGVLTPFVIDGEDEPFEPPQIESTGLSFTLNDSKDGYILSSYGSCSDKDVLIPSTYQGLPVTAVGSGVFQELSNIRSIEVPRSVKSIGAYAFAETKAVVIIRGSATIDASAFVDSNCNIFIAVYNSSPTLTSFGGKVYTLSHNPSYSGKFWFDKKYGTSIDLDSGMIEGPNYSLGGEECELRCDGTSLQILGDGVNVENVIGTEHKSLRMDADQISALKYKYSDDHGTTDISYLYRVSEKGFINPWTEELYTNLPSSFHGVQRLSGENLVGMQIGTTTVNGTVVPKLDIVVGGKVYMSFCNNKITIPSGITLVQE